MGWDEIWLTVKPLLTLPTPKMICIVDWRLGLLLRLMQAAILGVITYNILQEQTFLVRYTPRGVISLELYDGFVADTQKVFHYAWKNGDPENREICASENNRYNYDYGGDRKVTVTGCKALTGSQMSSQTEDTIFVSLVQTTVESRRAASPVYNNSNCEQVLLDDGFNCSAGRHVNRTVYDDTEVAQGGRPYWSVAEISGALALEGNGTCVCELKSVDFLAGAESVGISLDHIYTTPLESGTAKTYVRVDGGTEDKAVFAQGETVQFTIQDILDWTEVSLDEPANEGTNRQWLNEDNMETVEDGFDVLRGYGTAYQTGKYPYPRLTGLRMDVSLDYYNYALYSVATGNPEERESFSSSTWCVMTVKPELLWTFTTPKVSYYGEYQETIVEDKDSGVQIVITSGGLWGVYQLTELANAFISGFVLFQFATVACAFIARFAFGDKSRFYEDMMFENVNAAAEYARFAAKAMVASAFFDMVDESFSGEITKNKIFERLRKVTITQGVSVEETASLVEFMMEVADTGEEEDLGGMGDIEEAKDDSEAVATLNREEWVNIFVGPPCNVDSCISLIKRKNEQGRYIVPNSDKANYLLIDSEIQKDMKEKRVSRGKEKIDDKTAANGLGMVRQSMPTLPPDDIRKAMLMLRRQQQLVDRLEKQHLQTQKRMDIMRKEQIAQRSNTDATASSGSELEVYGVNRGGRGNEANGNSFSSFWFGG